MAVGMQAVVEYLSEYKQKGGRKDMMKLEKMLTEEMLKDSIL